MSGDMLILPDPLKLAGAEMIAADQAILLMCFDLKVFQSGL